MSTEAHDTGKEVDGTQADKVNAGALGTLVAVGLLAMISITAAVTALVRHDIEVEESDKAADANQVVISLKDAQRGDLNAPAHYADRKGTVALPIDLAKGLVVSELQKDPNSATPAPPAKEDAGSTAAPTASAGVTATDAGSKAEPASKGEPAKEKAAEPKPAPASSAKPAPGTPAKPAPAAPATRPLPTPTAATPGAESPGPVNH